MPHPARPSLKAAARAPGYSGKPLAQKLGLEAGLRLALIGAPEPVLPLLDAPDLEERIVISRVGQLPKRPFDVLHAFFTERSALAAALPRLLGTLQPDGMIWISWPKKTARVATDLTEDVIRAITLAAGLVDVKVCAVDEAWSGLKLVIRLRDRAARR